MDATIANTVTSSEQNEPKLPKNCKETRYYYKNRDKILEKQRLARLAKKGIDITKLDGTIQTPLEERRKKKMEFLGLLEK
jgi:hypothetical protein